MVNNDLNQLADMMVDWAGPDIRCMLESFDPETERDQATPAAREFLRCLVWTISQDPEAGRLLQALVQTERSSRRFRG